jgi:drug/metabolite transporter (DMT)-like permease
VRYTDITMPSEHSSTTDMRRGVACALLAAILFGASTPFAKTLLNALAPVALAGLLYLGSGLGLLAFYLLRALARRVRVDTADGAAGLRRADLPWLAGAVASGGVAGPMLLMLGLTATSAATASLLLNMEGVCTALLAWFAFRENADRRIVAGMACIVAGGVLLSWQGAAMPGASWGTAAIAGACLCWGLDNNLTRKISASDALQIAGVKGLAAGAVNLSIALALGWQAPALPVIAAAGLIGLCGYGLSLVMFVLALRHLGTARTGAYFSAAPFVGAALALIMLGERPAPLFWLAAALMGAGIWLHLTETHAHEHAHDALDHVHPHRHDAHHQHDHAFDWDGSEPHVHPHRHAPLKHTHAHYPDIHHRHTHPHEH